MIAFIWIAHTLTMNKSIVLAFSNESINMDDFNVPRNAQITLNNGLFKLFINLFKTF